MATERNVQQLQEAIFHIGSEQEFNGLALEIFRFQAENNAVYREFLGHLGCDAAKVAEVAAIPFLPIELFKTQAVKSFDGEAELVFKSSGTTKQQRSAHHVYSSALYQRSFGTCFQQFYGSPHDWCIMALLPGYSERGDSSLVFMAQHLIEQSNNSSSGFYLQELEKLSHTLTTNQQLKTKTLLLGVSHALLDLAEKFPQTLANTTIMETGGMKGQRKELTREELHTTLQRAFGVDAIHSEYGMTELLSQAYSKGNGRFECPPWMQVRVREINDPFAQQPTGKTGGINVIDLANIYSCSFIATQDLGKAHPDGTFEVLGRFDNSDLRGCNLLLI